MARAPQVTRTILTTTATVMCVNTENGTTSNEKFIFPRTYKDDKAILKSLEKLALPENIKPVHIVATEVNETLYGMSEQKFIENAEILPPRSKAEDETENGKE